MDHHAPSPWLAQLQQERPHFHLDTDTDCDVAVVGAGIAGMMTAYFLLKNTDKKVLLIDAGRIAHGATGRNAGQVVSYFERPLTDIARSFGTDMAVQGQLALESAWDLLESIIHHCNLRTPLYKCKGFDGLRSLEQIISLLEEKDIRANAGLTDDLLMVQASSPVLKEIPEHLMKYVMEAPHSTILRMLETEDPTFIAAEASIKGCTNSALLCEELAGWMNSAYPDRLTIAEHLPVSDVTLTEDCATLTTNGPIITARNVVLCTNGFENFTINNQAGEDIDPSFHHTVQGRIGYMAGYIDEANQKAAAISYYSREHEPYHYLTRRPYIHDADNCSLVCIGGPERRFPDRATYDPSTPFPADIEEELENAMRSTYRDLPPSAERVFLWQGLMGYTPNMLRRIGYEPRNKVLLYNLGCNGVGILPSVYGGKRISQLLAGMHLPPSIFDPENGDK